MYTAFITRIKNLRPHNNADRLQIGDCFGNSVIVSLQTQENELGIYFPVDGKIGIEYATKNNLLRKKDENGNQIGGFLDESKRNIIALKLRGEKSDGLFMPLSSLNDFTDISTLKEGDTISVLNGIVICEKYIPNRNRRTSSGGQINKKKNKQKSEISYPMFDEHVDTEQLAYNLNKFKDGDICYITLKMHGCFASDTNVKLWGVGKAKRIQNIKTGDVVIGYKDGKMVPSKVKNVFTNGTTCRWQHLKIYRDCKIGEKFQNIKCTPEHLFWNENNQLWIRAKDLNPGDKITTIIKSEILSDIQKSILVGKFLGDGYLFKTECGAELQFSHKLAHEEYVDYTVSSLGNIAYKIHGNFTSGYGSIMKRAKTKRIYDMKEFFDGIVPNDKENKLTRGIIQHFTPISLAFFYMDDGSLSHNNIQKDRAHFAVCDYNDHDVGIILDCFRKFDINAISYVDSEGYNRIRLNRDDAVKLFDLIYKYIPPIMRYKLPLEYREREFIKFNNNNSVFGYKFLNQKIFSNEEIIHKVGLLKYDIETETHNYVVGDCIVHNSSQRSANTIKEHEKQQNIIQKLLHLKSKPKKSWEYISGTRRVVLHNYDNGYYGDNQFRKQWHDFFDGKLQKGEEVFYEVVGYVNEDKLIMSECNNSKTKDKEFIKQYGATTKFTYGCENGESKIFVYRMTMTNEDNYTIEYPTELVKLRCEQMGVEFVPIFDKFIFSTQEDLMERVKKYYDGPDPIGKTHIREGVCLRIDNKQKFTAYKHKNFGFKLISGIIANQIDNSEILTTMSDDEISEL